MNEDLINVDISKVSPEEFVELIQYTSYCLHRNNGMTHKQLVDFGFPDEYDKKYENEPK